MDTAKAQALVDLLEDHIDDLDSCLQPVTSQALSDSTKKLPLLDKAKLHIVIVYAIESLLFSYLRLQNVDAKEHPVFRELTRVKQYFEKVKKAEEGPVQSRDNMSLNKQAAARIIKHALAGNEKLDLARLEQEAREKVLAKRKLKDLEASMKEKAQLNTQGEETQTIEQQLVDQIATELEQIDQAPSPEDRPSEEQTQPPKQKDKRKKRKHEVTEDREEKSEKTKSKAAKKARKAAKREKGSA